MSAIVWTDVLALAPELSEVDAAAKVDILAYANDALSVSVFGGEDSARLRLARIYLAAHYGSRAISGGAEVGEVASEQVGQVRRDYVTSGVTVELGGSGLRSTTYGSNYLALVDTSQARGPVLL